MNFRTASREDLSTILGWAAAEGWNPGLDDAAAFHAADPQGVFVAIRDGEPVAAISVVNHDPGTAFLGLYLCRPEWRGRGIGFDLWTHALTHAGSRSIGLDGVADQQSNYAKSGFVRIGASRRWEGRIEGAADPAVRLVAPDDLAMIETLDAAANGYLRPAFLSAWVAGSDTRRTVVLDEGGVRGYATARLCRRGAKVGPVIAPDAPSALRLARAALDMVGETILAIDLPESSAALAADLVARGFTNSFTTARMFRGPAPVSGPDLQAIATMELG